MQKLKFISPDGNGNPSQLRQKLARLKCGAGKGFIEMRKSYASKKEQYYNEYELNIVVLHTF